MSIEECYEQMGGSYKDVLSRIPSEELVKRFLALFLNDKSFNELGSAVKSKDREAAFIASHTLKGVCANLGLSDLCKSVSVLTEVLRPKTENIAPECYTLFEKVTQDYQKTITIISKGLADN